MRPVTLCPRHHRLLEQWTRRIVKLHPERRRHAAFGILGCLGDSWANLSALVARRWQRPAAASRCSTGGAFDGPVRDAERPWLWRQVVEEQPVTGSARSVK